jgi:hypothetical protein
MYIDLAPQVPVRASSPYNGMAILAVQDAVVALGGVARGRGIFTPEGLLPEARRVLRVAQGRIEEQLARNVFLRGTVEGAGVTP